MITTSSFIAAGLYVMFLGSVVIGLIYFVLAAIAAYSIFIVEFSDAESDFEYQVVGNTSQIRHE